LLLEFHVANAIFQQAQPNHADRSAGADRLDDEQATAIQVELEVDSNVSLLSLSSPERLEK
jgi:hypothetical protein